MAFRVPSFVFRARREKGQFQVEPWNAFECNNVQQLPLYCVMTPTVRGLAEGLPKHSIIAAT